jgi:hypothetical protein
MSDSEFSTLSELEVSILRGSLSGKFLHARAVLLVASTGQNSRSRLGVNDQIAELRVLIPLL